MKSSIVGGLFLFMTLVFGIDAFMYYTYMPSSGPNMLFYTHVAFAFVCLIEGVAEFMGGENAKVQ